MNRLPGLGLQITFALLALQLSLPRAELMAQEREPSAQGGKGSAAENPPTAKADLINESLLTGLPLNGRSYTQLVTLEAGVSDPSSAAGSRGVGGGNLTVSGSRSQSNTFLLDGTNIMDFQNRPPRSAAGVQLGSDAVLQVQVFSTTYGPEYGRNNGGVLNSITRSGSDELHGTFFEYFRNSKLDAREFFDRGPNPPPFKRNQFGFTLTGPVRKGKTYFMGSYEGMRDRENKTQVDRFPDAEARQGIITDAAGRPIRTDAAGQPIPIVVNPRVVPYLALMPLPNSTRLGGGFAQNLSPQFLPTDESFLTLRLDHQLSSRDSLFVRYTFDDATSHQAGNTVGFARRDKSRQQYLTLVASHVFRPSLLASTRLGYTRPGSYDTAVTSLQIPRSLYFVPDAPSFGQINVSGMAPFGPPNFLPSGDVANTFQFSSDVFAQQERHGLKFGVEVHRSRWDFFSSQNQAAYWNFNGLESFLQGGPVGTSVTVGLPGSNNKKAYRQTLVGLYGQDEYKIRPNLQLSLGLRYEFTTLLRDRYGRDSFLADPLRDATVRVAPLLPRNPSLRNFSPRLGLVWSPARSGSTSVSAGFGIYYDELLAYVLDLIKSGLPFTRIATRPNFNSSQSFPCAVPASNEKAFPDFDSRQSFPCPFFAATEPGFPLQTENLDYQHFSNPTVFRYHLNLQQRLGRDSTLQVAYVGARGNHLLRGYEANLFPLPIRRPDGALFFPPDAGPVNPAFEGGIRFASSDAQSFYNSLQIAADVRPVRSLSLRATYTFSKSADDASSIGFGPSTAQYGPLRTLDRGLSDFNIRHRIAINFFYTVPAGNGRSGPFPAVLSKVLGNWRVGSIVGFRTAAPSNIQSRVQRPGYLFAATRPNLLPGQSNNPTHGVSMGCKDPVTGATVLEAGQKLGGPDLSFDPCVFSVPEPGTIGNLGRNVLIGPSVFNADVSLQREFPLGNNRRLQLRAEFFNLLNHPNLLVAAGGHAVVFTGLGRFNPTAWHANGTATTSRQLQFALRFSF